MVRRVRLHLALCMAVAFSFWLAGSASAHSARHRPYLGPIPTNCPPSPSLQRFEPSLFGAGLGKNPVWAVGLQPSVGLVGDVTVHGWGVKVLWAIAPHTPGKVVLRGWNLRSGAPIWFSFNGVGSGTATYATEGAVIGPRQRGAQEVMPNGKPVNMHGWRGFPSAIYLRSAGCYVLFAQWRSGAWLVPFAAGG
jgi:hypothetical protein